MTAKIVIPREEQLAALADGMPALYRVIEKYTGGSVQGDFRSFVNVSKAELAEYLKDKPVLAEKHLMSEKEALLFHDLPVFLKENDKWLVCWIDHGSKVDKVYFDDLSEAAANYLMAYW